MTIDRQSVLRTLDYATDFNLTEEHLTLLRNACVGWGDGDYGAPEVEPKRPYGNSDVQNDVAKVLGWTWDGSGMPYAIAWRADQLHAETALALQICLSVGRFEAGRYERDAGFGRRPWRRVEAKS